MARGTPELEPAQVRLRHIYRPDLYPQARDYDTSGTVLTRLYGTSRLGVNGPRGFASGQYRLVLNENGDFSLRMPNAAGEDGVLHRDRFLIIQRGKRVVAGSFFFYSGGAYRPGDEWLEIYRVTQGETGDLLFVGTPSSATVTRGEITLNGVDGFWLGKKTRETAAGLWPAVAPRDAIEYYLGTWIPAVIEDFNPGPTISNPTNSDVVTSDGRLDHRQAASQANLGVVRLGPVTVSNTFGRVRTAAAKAITWGRAGPAPSRHQAWKVDVTLKFDALGDYTYGGLIDEGAGVGAYVQINTDGTAVLVAAALTKNVKVADKVKPGRHGITVEGRGKWIFYYLDGELLGLLPMPYGNYTGGVAFSQIVYGTGATSTVDVDVLALRRTQPFLLRGSTVGDYRIGGAPPPGGVQASYYLDTDLETDATTRDVLRLNPTRKPWFTRVERLLSGATGALPFPVGLPAGSAFSIRWHGSIYLDLAASDRFIRIEQSVAGAGGTSNVYVWVGKTRDGEELITWGSDGVSGWSGGLRAHLGGSLAGWYPIIVEVWVKPGWTTWTAFSIDWATSSGGAGAEFVPAEKLSPIGCYSENVRYESHYDQVVKIAETFALQFRAEPKSLESGAFPCEVVPFLRVGRDTEKIIDTIEADQISVELNAEETADALIADAAGLADPKQASQLTAEAFNFLEVEKHLIVHQEYESLAEITSEPLLLQRLTSLLLLRGSAWEQVSAVPRGMRELLDAFPLTGALAEFYWQPGDGVRIQLGEIGVEDASPRQILNVARDFAPDGLKRPTVGFRQRPRDLGDMLRGLMQSVLRADRNYQGQLVSSTGSIGSSDGSGVPVVPGDQYTRISLPSDQSLIAGATLVVIAKGDASAWTVEINGASAGFTVARPGRYDVLSWIGSVGSAYPLAYARLLPGTGTVQYMLELLYAS